MRVVLIYPYARIEKDNNEPRGSWLEPLPLEYLAATARLAGHDTEILDLRLPNSDIEQTLVDFQPDIVGFTGMTYHVLAIKDLARIVKTLRPMTIVVVGGHHATVMPEDFFCSDFDAVAQGEGILSFRKLLECLDLGDTSTKIPGLWRRIDGRFIFGGKSVLIELDELPLPDRQLTRRLPLPYFLCDIQPIALVRTSVGCRYRCKFCALWGANGNKILSHSISRVADELASVLEPTVFFADDEPFLQPQRMERLAMEIKRRAISKSFISTIRIDTLIKQRTLVALWREIGLQGVFIGIEAISPIRQNDYGKYLALNTIEQGLAVARNLGIDVYAGFIIHTNFVRRDFQEIARFIEHHRIRYPMFTVFTPLPSTEFFQQYKNSMNLLQDNRPDWDFFDLQHPVIPTQLPEEIFMQEYRALQRRFNFIHRPLSMTLRQQGEYEHAF